MRAWKQSSNDPVELIPQQTIDGVTIYRVEAECLDTSEYEHIYVETRYDYYQRYLTQLDTGNFLISDSIFSSLCTGSRGAISFCE